MLIVQICKIDLDSRLHDNSKHIANKVNESKFLMGKQSFYICEARTKKFLDDTSPLQYIQRRLEHNYNLMKLV